MTSYRGLNDSPALPVCHFIYKTVKTSDHLTSGSVCHPSSRSFVLNQTCVQTMTIVYVLSRDPKVTAIRQTNRPTILFSTTGVAEHEHRREVTVGIC